MPTFLKIRNRAFFKEKTKFEILKLPGYTLIEFLIVIAILSLSVGSILLFLTSTLKGANQVNVTAEVKQNGQSVLDNLQTQIRSSTKAEVFDVTQLPILGVSGLFLTLSTGDHLNVVCFNANVAGTSNGYIGVAKGSSISLPNGTASEYQILTNTNPVSGVDIVCTSNSGPGSGSFQVNANNNLVIIDFIANQGKQAPSRADYLANAQFKTTIGLRLY